MAVTTRAPESLARFDRVERSLHWLNAALFLTLMLTGAALYLQPLGELFGRRALVETVHVWCGVALPVPVLASVAGPWGRHLRDDLRRWNRWRPADRQWLRAVLASHRRPAVEAPGVGKFNAGQKLNAAFTAGAGLVLLGTGSIMKWYHPWPLAWRTGATFVHDWLALAVFVMVAGHVLFALRDPDALRSMFTGRISRDWAQRHAPGWVAGED
jgi:formate dehydrogenase gamma subunit